MQQALLLLPNQTPPDLRTLGKHLYAFDKHFHTLEEAARADMAVAMTACRFFAEAKVVKKSVQRAHSLPFLGAQAAVVADFPLEVWARRRRL